MKILPVVLIVGIVLNMFSACNPESEERPNILFVLADDLGYGELGCYGQEIIETPNIDLLAKNGMLFTQHYSGAPVCAPARCVLLTGKHMGHSYIRGNDELTERGKVWDFAEVEKDLTLEGQRPLPDQTVTVAKLLKGIGYKTACIGKWGLGPANSSGSPNNQGFDFFYGYNCQRQAHNYYPTHLWKNDEPSWLTNTFIDTRRTRFPEQADPHLSSNYSNFSSNDYAPDLMIKEALGFLDENKDEPFFMYYASPLPHVPLQVTKDWVDKYREIIGDEEPYTGKSYFPHQYPKATYAGMISYLDEQVGQLIQKLKELGEYDNTLIIFTSDNGATYTGGANTEFFNSNGIFDEKYGYGKGFLHEGGIRVPMIASWEGRIEKDSESNHISAFWDVLPTFCELANINLPTAVDGISFLPTLLNKEQESHPYLYWEFPEYNGQQAVRMGKWKAIRRDIHDGNMDIELYNLENDLLELNNIANKYPDIVKKIEQILIEEHQPSQIDLFKMEHLGDTLKKITTLTN